MQWLIYGCIYRNKIKNGINVDMYTGNGTNAQKSSNL